MRYIPKNRYLVIDVIESSIESPFLPIELRNKPKFMIGMIKEVGFQSEYKTNTKIVFRSEGLDTIQIDGKDINVVSEPFVMLTVEE